MKKKMGVKPEDSQHKNSATNIIFAAFISMLFTSGSYTTCLLLSRIDVDSNLINNYSNPTSIPWIDNQNECERTGRTWNNDKCWDSEHSAMF